MLIVVLTLAREIIRIFGGISRRSRNGSIALRLGIGNLYAVCKQILRKKPRCKNLLRIILIKYTYGRTLRYHLRVFRIKLRHGAYSRLKFHNLIFADIGERRVTSHPCGTCR